MTRKERVGDGDPRPQSMQSRMSRVSSTISSAGSRRTGTPLMLPPISNEPPKAEKSVPTKKKKGKNAVHSMQEVQQLARLREQQFLRSAHHCGSVDTLRMPSMGSETGGHTNGKREKRKHKEMLDITQTTEKIRASKTQTVLREAKMAVEAGLGETRMPPAKLAKLGRPKVTAVDNNIVDVINRHEATTRLTSKLKGITSDYMKAVAETFPIEQGNIAPEIIARNEDLIGKPYMGMTYDEYTKFYDCPGTRSRVSSGSASRSMSRCRSAASGKSH